MSTEALISTLIGSAIGIAATWFFAWFYYKRAGDDLQKEARYLEDLSTIMLRAMEDAGMVKLKTDEHGYIEGRVFELAGRGRINITGSGQMNDGVRDKATDAPPDQSVQPDPQQQERP